MVPGGTFFSFIPRDARVGREQCHSPQICQHSRMGETQPCLEWNTTVPSKRVSFFHQTFLEHLLYNDLCVEFWGYTNK